ncbi:MAG: ammonium transporter, partial [Actinomycetota bacterium]
MTPSGSLAVGLIAGIIYSVGHDALLRFKVDDALGVVPAHGFCGAWGIISLAIFAPAESFEDGRMTQLLVQSAGLLACVIWAGVVSWVVYLAIQKFIG